MTGSKRAQPGRERAEPGDRRAQPGSEQAPPTGTPALEVVAGHPSAEELAALTVTLAAVLAAHDRTAARAGQAARAASAWASRSRMLGAPLRPGPNAWRRSTRPG